MTPQTLAYWRFDDADQQTTDGSVVRDQTDRGNDLRVRRTGSAGPSTLQLSPDHDPRRSGTASLQFDGALPDRAALLQAVASAPINHEKFFGGYTIELFMKLPDPFIGVHDFMGIFSCRRGSARSVVRSRWAARLSIYGTGRASTARSVTSGSRRGH